jgi:hypothetical protein
MATNVHTMNLSDNGDGMVPLSDNPTTAFISNDPNYKPPERALPQVEKNVSENKQTMDSTPINELMMEPPMMAEEPRMQGVMPQMTAPQPQGSYAVPQQTQQAPESKNPLNLTDDQLVALIAGAAAALAVSKPVQDKLVTSVPKFLNEQGSRSMVGLASTGLVAAVVFYFAKGQLVKA